MNKNNIGLKITAAVIILALIGITRCVLETSLGIFLDHKWFSMSPDILFVMAVFPPYLCFFTFLCMHLILRAFGFRNNGEKLLIFLFFIQFLHLIIAPVDRLDITGHIPYNFQPLLNAQTMTGGFSLNPFHDLPNILFFPIYFTPLIMFFTLVTTPGMNLAWIITWTAFLIFCGRTLKLPFGKSILILCLTFQTIYWPVYKYYFVFDGVFNKLAGITAQCHFGYGLYFLAGTVIGIAYLLRALKEPDF